MTRNGSGKLNGIPYGKVRPGGLVDYPVVAGTGTREKPTTTHISKSTNSGEKQRTEQQEHLRVMLEEHGFIPTSNEELSMAYSIHSVYERHLGAASYLNRILLHQNKSVSQNPREALFKKVDNTAGYICGSKNALAAFDGIIDRTLNSPFTNNGENGTESLVEEMAGESVSIVGLRAIMRDRKVAELLTSHESQRLKLENPTSRYDIRKSFTGMSHSELLSRALAVQGQMEKRLEFWIKALRQFEDHRAVTPKVRMHLQRLGLSEK
ncbi:MAG TPA: hypothetical protein PKD19_02795 [Candidatus Saccharibacteria bacterium]|nr:hypothetical protein [Candidatus Saccharibacteria bacterium]HMR38486.1 hypothetical protein [Candidatus Saccharibacteria bacterium]